VIHTVTINCYPHVDVQVADDNALPELTAPVAGVILTLMANLRQCFLSHDHEPGDRERRDMQYVSLLDR